jgi:hypothetical protein
MPGNFPKSRHRSKPDHAAPFDLVLDRLGKQQDAPNGATSHSRVVPPGDWPYPAADVPPVSPAAATAQMYDLDMAGAVAKATPRSIEEAVTQELQLSDDLAPADLERIRRTFAYRNHPDRVGPAHKMHALRRMTVANVLIDQALKTARARAR